VQPPNALQCVLHHDAVLERPLLLLWRRGRDVELFQVHGRVQNRGLDPLFPEPPERLVEDGGREGAVDQQQVRTSWKGGVQVTRRKEPKFNVRTFAAVESSQ
jgi:hypothetical protein